MRLIIKRIVHPKKNENSYHIDTLYPIHQIDQKMQEFDRTFIWEG